MSFWGDLTRAGIKPDRNGGFTIDGKLVVAGGLVSTIGHGNVYFVDPANGVDAAGRGRSPDKAFATISYGESKLTANQNDILVYMQGATSAYLEEPLVWDKDYTHFVGVGAPTHAAQRARIFNKAGAAYDTALADSALIKLTAKGCIFDNLYLFQGADKTTESYFSMWITGGRNYFNNIHFAGLGATASTSNAANSASAALFLDGAEENLFVNCTVGVDTIKRTADNAILKLDNSATRNEFRGCKFVSYAETNTYCIVKLADTTALDRYTIFKDCLFYNFWENHTDKLLECFEIPANCATHDIILDNDCVIVGIDEWEANDRGSIWVGAPTGSAATQGIAVEPAT